MNSATDIPTATPTPTDIVPSVTASPTNSVFTETPMGPQTGSSSLYAMFASTPGMAGLATGVVVGAGVVTVGAVVYIKDKVKAYRKEIVHKEVEYALDLFKEHLQDMVVYEEHTKISMPPIFEETGDGYDFIHFSPKQILAMGLTPPGQSDPVLAEYMECIIEAIEHLKDFYFRLGVKEIKDKVSLKTPNDVVRAVICYFLFYMDRFVSKFEGFEKDAVVVKGIRNYMAAYSSRKEDTNTRDFSGFKRAYQKLGFARNHLLLHKDNLSMHHLINDLRRHCRNEVDQLIKLFAILTNNNKYREHLRTATKSTIASGKVRTHAIADTYMLDTIKIHKDEILLDETPFKKPLMDLALHARLIVNCDVELTDDTLPEIKIDLPDTKKYYELANKKKLNELEKEELKALKDKLKALQKMFKMSQNFITKRLVIKKNGETELIAIEGEDHYNLTVERARVDVRILSLIRGLILGHYFGNQIQNALYELGNIWFTSPENAETIDTLQMGFTGVLELVKQITKDISQIDKDVLSEMDLIEEISIQNKFEECLDRITTFIKKAQSGIKTKNKELTTMLETIQIDKMNATTKMMQRASDLGTIRFKKNTTNNNLLELLDSQDTESMENNKILMITESDSFSSIIEKRDQSEIKIEPVRTSKSNKALPTPKRLLHKTSTLFSSQGKAAKQDSLNINSNKQNTSTISTNFMKETVSTTSEEKRKGLNNFELLINKDNNVSANSIPIIAERSEEIMALSQSKEEVKPSKELVELEKTGIYLKKLIIIQKKMDSMLSKIEMNNDQYKESFLKLHANMLLERKNLQKMIYEEEKEEERHDTIHNILEVLEKLTQAIINFFIGRDEKYLKEINELITEPNYAKFIDKHKISWMPSFISTPTRDNFGKVNESCNTIIKLMETVHHEDNTCSWFGMK